MDIQKRNLTNGPKCTPPHPHFVYTNCKKDVFAFSIEGQRRGVSQLFIYSLENLSFSRDGRSIFKVLINAAPLNVQGTTELCGNVKST